jgi:hypothetical protein
MLSDATVLITGATIQNASQIDTGERGETAVIETHHELLTMTESLHKCNPSNRRTS